MIRRTRHAAAAALAALLLLLAAGVAQAVPADVKDHWAYPAINDLMRRGILAGYPDHTFKPDRFVSRAEFAKIAVKAFHLPAADENAFTDTAGHWARRYIAALAGSGIADGYSDGTYRPDQSITRAEMVSMLDKLLGLGTEDQVFGQDWTPSYPDVSESHWAFRLVEVARRLDYLPPSYGASFLPEAVVTRAETAWMVDRVVGLERTTGTAAEINGDVGTLTVMPEDGGDPELVQVDPEALVLRNNSSVSLGQVMPDDRLQTLAGRDGLAKVVKASGRVNTNDLVSRLNGLTRGVLTPEAVAAIAKGDWTAAQEGLKNILFDRLLETGLSPGEAQSLLDRDWVTLDLLSRDQLVNALSGRLGISTDLSEAILARDLTRLKEVLQTEITAAALERFLQPPA